MSQRIPPRKLTRKEFSQAWQEGNRTIDEIDPSLAAWVRDGKGKARRTTALAAAGLAIIIWLASLVAAAADEATALTAAIVHAAGSNSSTIRYVWLQTGVKPEVVDLAMNLACPTNDVGDIVRGQVISDQVIAYDLADFDPADPGRLVSLWESMALDDPIFHVSRQLQQGTADSEAEEGEQAQPAAVAILAPHLASYVAKDITKGDDKRLDVILSELSQSAGPMLEARFLIEQLLDLRYYEFRNIAAGDDFLKVLARSGYFLDPAKKSASIKANYLGRSLITGDQRIIVATWGLNSPTPATITYDLFDGNNRPEAQLVRNLERFDEVADGSEAFIPMANGLIEFLLIDGSNALVEAAPPNLAADHTKPAGHDSILRPAISCLACHIIGDGQGMYRGIRNQFSQLPSPGLLVEDQVRLQKIFSRDLDQADGILGRARRDFIVAINPLVSGEEPDRENVLIGELVKTVRDYRYDLLTAETQARELGLPEGQLISEAILPSQGDLIDPEVYLALQGVSLSREGWNAIRIQLAAQLQGTRQEESDASRASDASGD